MRCCEHDPRSPKILFKIPRVRAHQRQAFESEEFFRKHSKEGEVSCLTGVLSGATKLGKTTFCTMTSYVMTLRVTMKNALGTRH
jgi:hypothetical protein